MSREPAAPPNTWGTANVGMTDEWFQRRISGCRSLAHIRSAIEYEAQRETPRRERIGQMNQQVKRIKGLE